MEFAMQDYYAMFIDTMGMFLFLGAELSILFILISAAVNILQQYIPDSKVQALLGGSHGRGYFLAALIGAITPFCSCSTIPMLRGLLKAKAGFGPTLTFLFASPLLNPIILGLFVATFGLKVAIIYTAVALLTSLVAGYVLNKMKYEQYVIPESATQSSSSCCGTSKKHKELKPLNTLQTLQPLQPMHQVESSCCSTAKPLQTLEPLQQASACCSTPLQELKIENSCCGDSHAKQGMEHVKSPCSCNAEQTLQPLKPLQPLEAQSSCCGGDETKSSCCGGDETKSSCCGGDKSTNDSCCGTSSSPVGAISFKQRIKLAFADAWLQFKQIFVYLLFGVSLGALVYGFVPSDFIAKYASGDSLFAVPIAAIIGIPLYVRVEALIPLSSVLVGKGMGLGAVMALIIGGGGASLTEVILLKSMFRTPMIIAFLVVILGMAISAGYLFQFIL